MHAPKSHSILRQVIDRLIPENFKKNTFLFAKVRAYIFCLMLISFLGVALTVFTKLIISESRFALFDLLLSVVCLFCNIGALLMLNLTRKLWVSYMAASVSALLTIDFITYDSGGLYSTTLLWSIFIPIGAFILLGIRGGILWSVIILINAVAFYPVHLYSSFNLSLQSDVPLVRAIDIFFVFAVMLLIILFYERGRNRLMSRLVKFNRKIRHQNENLNLLNREKEELMSIVAHDLKSPIKSVSGLLNLISLTGKLTSEQQQYISTSNEVIKRANQLINDLLYFHEITEKKTSQTKEVIQVKKFCDEITLIHQAYASEKNITLLCEYKFNDPSIRTYPGTLMRILDNLLSNAIKFSPEGNNVNMKVSQNNTFIIFAIKDFGPGINTEDQKKLFARFQKLSAVPTNNENSTGLGLSIVKSLVQMVQGKISVQSEEGKGSEFTIEVPFERVESVKLKV